MTFVNAFRTAVRESLDLYGAQSLAQQVGVNYRTLQKWAEPNSQAPRADLLGRVLDLMGYALVKKGMPAEELVTYANIQLPKSYGLIPKPEDLVAIPRIIDLRILEDGWIPETNISHVDYMHRSTPVLQFRRDLIAVNITDRVMSPLLDPGDVVIVDRGDRKLENNRLYLARDPSGDTFIRRVLVSHNADTHLTFVSDKHVVEPKTYGLNKDFGGDIARGIIGRVVWFRGDMLNL